MEDPTPLELLAETSEKQHTDLLRSITVMTDLADRMLESMKQDKDYPNQVTPPHFIERYRTQIGYSCNILRAMYCQSAFDGKQITSETQEVMEKAFRNAVFAYDEFQQAVIARLSAPVMLDPAFTTLIGSWTLP